MTFIVSPPSNFQSFILLGTSVETSQRFFVVYLNWSNRLAAQRGKGGCKTFPILFLSPRIGAVEGAGVDPIKALFLIMGFKHSCSFLLILLSALWWTWKANILIPYNLFSNLAIRQNARFNTIDYIPWDPSSISRKGEIFFT